MFLRTFIIGLALLLGTHAALAQDRGLSDRGQFVDGIAAVVNDGVVLKSELAEETRRIVQRLEAQGTAVPPQRSLLPQVLERLIVNRIQLQRCERMGIEISDETLNNALNSIAERNDMSITDLPQMLASEGINYQQYRREMREQLAIEQLHQHEVLGRIAVTPREIDEYLARQEGQAAANMEYELSHILVAVSSMASPETIAAAENKISDLYQRLQAGEDFSELAVTHSDGQQALEGGSMGWKKGDELPTVFADIVPQMQKGEVSEPIRSGSGLHLVKLNDRRGGEPIIEQQTHVRHILVMLNEVLDDDAAREKLAAIRTRIVEGEDDFATAAKAVSDDPGSKVEGGDLGWTGPDSFAPEFQTVVDSLPENEVSDVFRSRFGWHIVEVLGRRTQDTTEAVKRQQAAIAIRNSRVGEETDIWTQRLRDEAFVEIRI